MVNLLKPEGLNTEEMRRLETTGSEPISCWAGVFPNFKRWRLEGVDSNPNTLMRYNCPHCGVSLKGKRIPRLSLPGEWDVLPFHACKACPKCGGWLAVVHQPWDKTWRNWYLGFLTVSFILDQYFTWSDLPNRRLCLSIVHYSSILILIVSGLLYDKTHHVDKNAPKYRAVSDEDIKSCRYRWPDGTEGVPELFELIVLLLQ